MPDNTSVGIINASLANSNLQGQIAVQVGHGIVMDKLHALDSQRQQNEIARLTELTKPRPMPLPSSGDSPESLYAQAKMREELDKKTVQIANLKTALNERDALLLEWMHGNVAFKKLAQQYGKKLGITEQQQSLDVLEKVLDAAEEEPQFQVTKVVAKARNALGGKI